MEKYLQKLFCIAVMLCNSFAMFAQSPADKAQVNQLNGLALKFLIKPDSSIVYADRAYALSKEINYKFGEATALKLKGIYEHRKSRFVQALEHYQQSLSFFKELNIPLEMGKLNLNIATSYNSQHDYAKSVAYGLQALKIFEDINDPNGKGRVLNLLGIASFAQKDFQEALTYFKKYNYLAKKAKDSIEIASSYNNIGSTFEKLGVIDSAIYYTNRSSVLHAKKGNTKGLGTNYENIGNLYKAKQDLKNALIYYRKSLKAYQVSGDRAFMSHSYYNIGNAYKMLKDTVNAVKWLDRAVLLAGAVGEKEILKNAHEKIAEIKVADNQYKSAFENLQNSVRSGDSILNLSKNRIVEELKTQYEVDKKNLLIKNKEIEISNQKLKVQKRNTQLIAAGIFIIGILLSAYLIYNRNRLNAKADLQEEINKQQDLAARSVLDAEERERRRIAGDLHDGVGQTLSAALMNLSSLFKQLSLTGINSEKADRAVALVTESYDEMRSISHQMMPNALIKAGLASAVKEFLNKIDSDKIKISLETVGLTGLLNEQTETVLYRIIQETVNNVIKHSGANKLNIQLLKDDEGITVTIEDNGKGFDKKKANMKTGIGLANMHSRVAFLKGSIDIDTAIDKGTHISVFIPNV